ncbi:MAG: SulP family inorganic anion transporter [Elusimicrobiota bacterium]
MTRDEMVLDAWGALAAMLVALPQALAFGVIIHSAAGPGRAAEGALAGIIGAAVIGIVAPLLGGAPRLISGPCAPAAAVMAALAASLAGGPEGPARVLLLLTLTALLCGCLQFLYGSLGGGTLIKFIPYPVVTGYLSSVAVLIFLSQVPKVLGLPKDLSLWRGLAEPGLWSATALLIGGSTIAVMAAAPRWTRAVPAPILGLAAGLLAYLGLSLFHAELRSTAANPFVVGPIPDGGSFWAGFAQRWGSLRGLGAADLLAVLSPALTLSVLLSIDTLKSCVAVDALARSRHDSNRVLLGQGLANVAAALAGGVPGAGTMGATLVNIHAGGRTRLSGALAGAFSLIAFLLARPLIAWIPIPALAGILLVVAYRMFDRKTFRLLRKRSTMVDFAVAATVIAVAVGFDLVSAAGAGLALSILLFIRDQIRVSVMRRKTYGDQVNSKQKRLSLETALLEVLGRQTVICELQGSLFFGTTDQLFTELEADLKTCKYVILDLKRVQSVDFTAVHMLKQIEDYLHEREGRLLLCSLPPSLPTGQDLQSYFGEVGLVKPQKNVSVFGELDEALEWAEDSLLAQAQYARPASEAALDLAEIDLLRELEPELLAALRGCVREVSLEAGSKLFAQGDAGDELFLIRRGTLRIMLRLEGGKSHHLATFRRSDVVGEVAFLDRGTRTTDAVATAPSELYALSRARFDELALRQPVLAVKVFARLARGLALRLRRTDIEVRALEGA